MTKLFIEDKDAKMVEQIGTAVDLVYKISDDLRYDHNVSKEDEIIERLRSASHELEICAKIFIAERLMLRPEKT